MAQEIQSDIVYAALGDSYSSGCGAGEYYPWTNVSNNECMRSKYAYSTEYHGVPKNYNTKRHFFACKGAKIKHVVDTFWNGLKDGIGEMPQSSHDELENADIITFSIGGNDIFFAEVMKECVFKHQCHREQHESEGMTYEELMPIWREGKI